MNNSNTPGREKTDLEDRHIEPVVREHLLEAACRGTRQRKGHLTPRSAKQHWGHYSHNACSAPAPSSR